MRRYRKFFICNTTKELGIKGKSVRNVLNEKLKLHNYRTYPFHSVEWHNVHEAAGEFCRMLFLIASHWQKNIYNRATIYQSYQNYLKLYQKSQQKIVAAATVHCFLIQWWSRSAFTLPERCRWCLSKESIEINATSYQYRCVLLDVSTIKITFITLLRHNEIGTIGNKSEPRVF